MQFRVQGKQIKKGREKEKKYEYKKYVWEKKNIYKYVWYK
jgi:hypothetical protein